MCEGKRTCQKPKKLVVKPQDCTPEQIKDCHGTDKEHPCVKQAKRK
jgi:hypothetical protein